MEVDCENNLVKRFDELNGDGLVAEQAFDYSTLDKRTAEQLQILAQRVLTAKQRYALDLMEIVAAAHQKIVRWADMSEEACLAIDKCKNMDKNTTFVSWCASVGIARATAYNLLQVKALMDASTQEEQEVLQQAPAKLLYAAARFSAPAELVQAVKDGDITTHKQYQEAMKELRERDTKIRDLIEKGQASDRRAGQAEEQLRQAKAEQQKVENLLAAERERASKAEKDAAGWKNTGLEMQEIVDKQSQRIRELEAGITIEATALDAGEVERRVQEATQAESEKWAEVCQNQQHEIQRLASGSTVAAQATVLNEYLQSMMKSVLCNAQQVELSEYDMDSLDGLSDTLREFATKVDELFWNGGENDD